MCHPIVLQMCPSDEQKPAIRARGHDIVVTAGAGTGKTSTLVARYLSLLAESLPLRSVIAITFTKKAAREMRNRVREAMDRYLRQSCANEGGTVAPEERERWQRLYAELDAARIGTIHSLCTEILRAHPAEAEVDPRFEVLDEGQSNILCRQAIDEALAWAADNEEAVILFALLGERSLRLTLDRLVKRRLDTAAALAHLPADVSGHWRQVLAGRQQEALTALLSGSLWLDAVDTLRENAARLPDDRIECQRRDALAAIDGATGQLEDRIASLSRLGSINLSGGGGKAWPGGQEQLRDVKNALRTLRDVWKQAALSEGSFTPLDEELAQAVPALRALFTFACQRYDLLKQGLSALDFDDLEQRALTLLQRNGSVRARWQGEARAILVDEFQDTNGRQRDLVALLNGDRGRLFIVGDAKQSIYRFRGADVTIFRAERERIDREGGFVYALDTSYRAHRDLVNGLNDLLRPVLGEQPDPARPWAEPFVPLRHYREEPISGGKAPYVELLLAVGTKSGGALARAAEVLAERIAELKDDGGDYGEVAILCRASTSFAPYEDALDQAGIPFRTVAGRGFYQRPEIRDLLNALEAVADPTDDLALVGLLRSPAFSLSDAALYSLCQQRREQEETVALWDVLRERGQELLAIEGARAARCVRIVGELHEQVGRTRVADLLKSYLDATGYRAALIQAGQSRGVRNVAKLLADAHASGIVSVGEFLEYVSSLRDSGTREGEARATTEGAVQIMTVHAAKGLEFQVVVIGDVTYQGRGGGGVLVDPDLGVLLPLKGDDKELPAIYRLGKACDSDKDAAESDRLLYVAATRARERLILSGCIGLTADGMPGKCRGWLAQMAGSQELGLEGARVQYDETGAEAIHASLQIGQTPVACTVFEPRWKCRAASCERQMQPAPEVPLPPPLLHPVSFLQEHVDARTRERDRRPPRRVWRVVPVVKRPRAPAWVVGSLVHEALAAWRFPDDTFERWAKARARGYGITDIRQLDDAARKSQGLLQRFRAHALFIEMDSAQRRLHEVPYSLMRDGHVESGVMDALYLRDDTWTIVEFKTDEVRDEAEFTALLDGQGYRKQAKRYVEAAEHLLGQQPRLTLCMLNFGGKVELRTDLG